MFDLYTPCALYFALPVKREDIVRDSGVMFVEKSNFRIHIQFKINMACKMVGLVTRNFKYLSISSFVLVYKNLVMYRNCTIVIVCGHHTEIPI